MSQIISNYLQLSQNLSKLSQVHMPATGVSGVDLYCRTPAGAWRWVNGAGPTAQDDNCVALIPADQDFPPGEHEFLVRPPPLLPGETGTAAPMCVRSG